MLSVIARTSSPTSITCLSSGTIISPLACATTVEIDGFLDFGAQLSASWSARSCARS
jgi:hypothetical protein